MAIVARMGLVLGRRQPSKRQDVATYVKLEDKADL